MYRGALTLGAYRREGLVVELGQRADALGCAACAVALGRDRVEDETSHDRIGAGDPLAEYVRFPFLRP